MLSPKLLEALREHWRSLRQKPTEWLFPGNRWHTANHPIDTKVAWQACQAAAQRAGIQKEVHPHTLRHYAEFRTMPSKFLLMQQQHGMTGLPERNSFFGLGIVGRAVTGF